jgi:hypothetical protein
MRKDITDSPRVRVFVPPSFEGVVSVAVLEEIIHDNIDLEIVYTGHLDFREYDKFKDVEIIISLGLPYKGYALSDDFYLTVDVPFVDFIHSSTYGEQIKGKHIISDVNADMDPIKDLYQLLKFSPESTILSKHVSLTDKAYFMVEAANAYRTWTWETNDTTRMLLALYHASYKRLPKLIRGLSLQDMVKQYAPVIKGQIEKMNDYIERKRSMVKNYTVTIDGESCLLKVVYAEEYINELANDLLNRERTPMPVIVCVGRTTKSSDMFSIRTRIANAAKVAYLINEGNGKENVASVFTGISSAELMGNGFVNKLSQTTL